MIHSKVVVVDPFGKKPVVMTGSHNMGPKASAENDDNLAIIENAPGLAQEYAVNILGVYGHYKWLYNAWKKAQDAAGPTPKGKKAPPIPVNPSYDGNVDSDAWQGWERTGENLQQTQFLMGLPITASPIQSSPGATSRKPPKTAAAKKGSKRNSPAKRKMTKKSSTSSSRQKQGRRLSRKSKRTKKKAAVK